MPVDADDPVDFGRDLVGDVAQQSGKPGDLFAASLGQGGLSGGEQHLGLKHEAVAHDLHALAPRQDLRQPAKEFGPIAGQVLGLGLGRKAGLLLQRQAGAGLLGGADKGGVQLLAQVGHAQLCIRLLLPRRIQQRLQRPQLRAQLRHLFVQRRHPALAVLRQVLLIGQLRPRGGQQGGLTLGLGQLGLGLRLRRVAGGIRGGQQGQGLLRLAATLLQGQGHGGQFGIRPLQPLAQQGCGLGLGQPGLFGLGQAGLGPVQLRLLLADLSAQVRGQRLQRVAAGGGKARGLGLRVGLGPGGRDGQFRGRCAVLCLIQLCLQRLQPRLTLCAFGQQGGDLGLEVCQAGARLGQLGLSGGQLAGQAGDAGGTVAGLRLGAGGTLGLGLQRPGQVGLAILGRVQRLAQGRDLRAQFVQLAFLARDDLTLIGDRLVLGADRVVLGGDLFAQHPLDHGKDRQHEHQHQKQRRHRVDEARPDRGRETLRR